MKNTTIAQSYRADIDGLRAIAVGLVVLFHAFPNQIPAGFVGVDIFFVISGFLISSIIIKKRENSTFSLTDFYQRRIRRIFPALAVVLVSSLGLGWFTLFANEYIQLGFHTAGGAAFIANFLFWQESGYFDTAANTKPLLHLWSLGIEEQFYIFWPIMIFLLCRILKYYNVLVIVLIVMSFTLNLYQTATLPVSAFFSPLTRFWELLLGALIASGTLRCVDGQAPNRCAANTKSTLGLGLIIGAALFIPSTAVFPGAWALFPTLGAVLIISAGADAWINRKLLSQRTCVSLGLISYPLYLWHWPLLSFARIVEGYTPSYPTRFAAVGISCTLAMLTYAWVERPIRARAPSRASTLSLVTVMAAIGLFGYITIGQHHGYPDRVANLPSHIYEEIGDSSLRDDHLDGSHDRVDARCRELVGNRRGVYCRLPSLSPSVLIIGDSHAIAFAYSQVTRDNPEVAVVAANGCMPSRDFTSIDAVNERLADKAALCSAVVDVALTLANRLPSIRRVALVSRGPLYVEGTGFGEAEPNYVYRTFTNISGNPIPPPEAFMESFTQTIDLFAARGKQISVVLDVPEIGISPTACVERPFRISRTKSRPCRVPYVEYAARQTQYRSIISRIQKHNPMVSIFDPEYLFCDREWCSAAQGGKFLYFDDDHLSLTGSEVVFSAWYAAQKN